MIVVRQVFQVQFGRAGELVEAMKEGMRGSVEGIGLPGRWRLLTDLSGPFDTVVLEVEAESLAQWEAARVRLFASPEFQEEGRRTHGLITGGRGELYTLEASG